MKQNKFDLTIRFKNGHSVIVTHPKQHILVPSHPDYVAECAKFIFITTNCKDNYRRAVKEFCPCIAFIASIKFHKQISEASYNLVYAISDYLETSTQGEGSNFTYSHFKNSIDNNYYPKRYGSWFTVPPTLGIPFRPLAMLNYSLYKKHLKQINILRNKEDNTPFEEKLQKRINTILNTKLEYILRNNLNLGIFGKLSLKAGKLFNIQTDTIKSSRYGRVTKQIEHLVTLPMSWYGNVHKQSRSLIPLTNKQYFFCTKLCSYRIRGATEIMYAEVLFPSRGKTIKNQLVRLTKQVDELTWSWKPSVRDFGD